MKLSTYLFVRLDSNYTCNKWRNGPRLKRHHRLVIHTQTHTRCSLCRLTFCKVSMPLLLFFSHIAHRFYEPFTMSLHRAMCSFRIFTTKQTTIQKREVISNIVSYAIRLLHCLRTEIIDIKMQPQNVIRNRCICRFININKIVNEWIYKLRRDYCVPNMRRHSCLRNCHTQSKGEFTFSASVCAFLVSCTNGRNDRWPSVLRCMHPTKSVITFITSRRRVSTSLCRTKMYNERDLLKIHLQIKPYNDAREHFATQILWAVQWI